MFEQVAIFSYKSRLILGCILAVLFLSLLSLLPPPAESASLNGSPPNERTNSSSSTPTEFAYDGPNAVTGVMVAGTNKLSQAIDSSGIKSGNALKNVGNMVYRGLRNTGIAAATSVRFVASIAGKGITFAAYSMIDGVLFTIHMTGSIVGVFTNMPVASAFLQPADKMPVPVIDTAVAQLALDHAVLPATQTASQPSHLPSQGTIWPISGGITTEFGVPHWPFQPTHTGMDISSGQPSGVKPVVTIKPGVVIATLRSGSGFGNHVIVDHGEGLTSLYAHLASISVQNGQAVDQTTVLGYEGSTGASTGTHLHLEIRLNGQPVNPRQYISGHP